MRVNVISSMPFELNSNKHIPGQLYSELSCVDGVETGVLCDVNSALNLPDSENTVDILIGSVFRKDFNFNSAISALKMKKHKVVLWLHDDPYEHDATANLFEPIDLLVTNEVEAVDEYHEWPTIALPLATDVRTLDYPVPQEKSFDFSFIGHCYPNRELTLNELHEAIKKNRRIWKGLVTGSGWQLGRSPYAVDRRVTHEAFLNLSARSRCSLYLNREGFDLANDTRSLKATAPGPRFFDVAALGIPQIALTSFGFFDRYFECHEAIVYVNSVSDIIETLEQLSDFSSSQKVKAMIRDNHLYRHRVHDILEKCT